MMSDSLRSRAHSANAPVPRGLLVWLTIGVAGTLVFPLVYLIEGATRPGYDAWQGAISTLSLGPGGWVQQANFVLCGVSVLWLALVWRRILRGGVGATWYPIARGIEGVGLIVIGFVSTDPSPAYPPGTTTDATTDATTLGGTVHYAVTVVIISMMVLGLLIMARRFWGDPAWRGWAAYSAISGVVTIVFIGAFAWASDPLAGYAGIVERVATVSDTVWGAVLLIPLWCGRGLRRPATEQEGRTA